MLHRDVAGGVDAAYIDGAMTHRAIDILGISTDCAPCASSGGLPGYRY